MGNIKEQIKNIAKGTILTKKDKKEKKNDNTTW